MSESSRATPEKKQVQPMSPQNETPDQEKEQLKSEILKLKETISQNESLRERVIDAEAKISSLQQSNDNLSQQVQNLTFQNNQLLKELAALKNLRASNSNHNEDTSNNNNNNNSDDDIHKLKKAFSAMQQKFQQELAFKDDIIQNMRENINFNKESPQNITDEKIQNKKQKLKQQRYIIKQNLAKKKNDVMKELIIVDSDNSDSSSQRSNSQADQKLLEQKYVKKKNELILMKQQFDELKEESHHQIKKSQESVDEVRQKFHLLKKKYIELKEDFSSLQVCYQAVVQKAEALSAELQRANKNIDDHFIEDLPKITIKTRDYKLHKAEEKNQQKDKYKEMKKRAQKAEKESEQLRCFIQVLANNEKNFNKLNLNNQNIINQLEALGIKIDRLGSKDNYRINALPKRQKSNDYQEPNSAQRKRMNDYQEKKQINIYQEVHSHQRKKSNDNQKHHSSQRTKIDHQRHHSPQGNVMNDYQDSYSPQSNNKFGFQDYSSSPKRRSKSVKKEMRKLPSWRKFKDF